MKAKKKRWQDRFATQTELGKEFGLSSIAVGKILIEAGLRDASTKQPTERAITEQFAVSTPMKDGTPFHMWSKEKVFGILSQKAKRLSHFEKSVRKVEAIYKEAGRLADDGNDKVAMFLVDSAYDDIDPKIVDAVTIEVVKRRQK